ncbi:GNAT family N-acetyltransferase [Vibrio hepatarius]|uniref:GNAT family N-acetyltransferase n=1 Tax=Vibrio hepatarius TaxID=171383 RepID=UPI001C0858D6|nr:GNAT family N-acetyltransferase [Vibrio hepatarius]MBU2895164.1 GNAT family N-acetyltransferase [Vibrio hepatarius]
MRLELLSEGWSQQLLQFELENKDWFESMIPPRDIDFYSSDGFKEHIKIFLLEYKAKTLIPMLIVNENGVILGRVNVSNVDHRKKLGHIGYRVGKNATNRGVAKFAVANMIRIVQKLGLSELIAYASTTNLASKKVLLANGFQPVALVSNYAELNGSPINCIKFKLSIK